MGQSEEDQVFLNVNYYVYLNLSYYLMQCHYFMNYEGRKNVVNFNTVFSYVENFSMYLDKEI